MRHTRVLALVCTLIGLAACGGQPFPQSTGGAGNSSRAVLLAAISHTNAAKSARLAMHMEISGIPVVGDETVDMAGVMDMTAQSAAFTMTVSGGGQSQTVEARVVGGVAYVNVGGTWQSRPLNLGSNASVSPTDYLAYLEGVANDVHVVGPEVVRGAPTTHYAGTIDLGRALSSAQLPAAQRVNIRKVLDVLGDLQLPFDVWLDRAGLLRKLMMTMDLSNAVQRAGGPSNLDPMVTVTVEMYDFGIPVHVQAPG